MWRVATDNFAELGTAQAWAHAPHGAGAVYSMAGGGVPTNEQQATRLE